MPAGQPATTPPPNAPYPGAPTYGSPSPGAAGTPGLTAPNYALWPPVLPYRSGVPVPEGYRVESKANNGLVIGGFLTLLVGYSSAFIVGMGNDFENGTGWLAVPVVGPFAALASRENPCAGINVEEADLEDAECIEAALDEAQLIAFMTVDGIVQLVGATLTLIGATTGTTQLVRHDVAGLRLDPLVGPNLTGVSARARF